MVELALGWIIGYLFGFITVCILEISREASNEEKKTIRKSKKHTNNKR